MLSTICRRGHAKEPSGRCKECERLTYERLVAARRAKGLTARGRPRYSLRTHCLHGHLRNLQTKVLDSDDMVSLMKAITPERNQQELQEEGGTDFGFAYGDAARFRVSVFRQRGDISFRCNFATVDDHQVVIDRRAGRITAETDELARALNGMQIEDVTCLFKESVAHRAALVLHGPGLGAHVTDIDPHADGEHIWEARPVSPDDAERDSEADERQRVELLPVHGSPVS